MTAARLAALPMALAIAGCECVGFISPSNTFVPIGTGEIDDTPQCIHRVPAGTPTAQWTRMGPPGASIHSLLPLGGGGLLLGTGLAQTRGVLTIRSAGIYRSTDQGRTVTQVLSLPSGSVESLVKADNVIFAGVSALEADGGVFQSSDQGMTFQAASTGLHVGAQVAELSVAAGVPSRVYALVKGTAAAPGSAATTLYAREGAQNWQLLPATGLDPTRGGPLRGIAADPTERDRLFAVDGAALYRSSNGGQSFEVMASQFYGPPSGVGNASHLRALAGSPPRLLISTTDTGVLETRDLGTTFTELLPGAVGTYPSVSFALASADGLLVGTNGSGLMRLGSSTPVGNCLLDRVVLSAAVAPDDGAIWVGTNGGLYLSTDGAQSFTTVGAGLTENLGRFTVAEVEGAPTAFLTSTSGLYRYTLGSAEWERQGDWAKTVGFSDLTVAPGGELGFASVDEEFFPGRYAVEGSVWQWKLKEHKVLQLAGIGANVGAVRADPQKPGAVYAYQRAAKDSGLVTGVLSRAAQASAFAATSLVSETLSTSVTFRFSPLAVASDGTVYAGTRLPDGTPALLRSDDSGATRVEVWRAQGWIAYGVYVDASGAVLLTGNLGNIAVRRSTDRGQTFSTFDDGLTGFAKVAYSLTTTPSGGLLVGTEDGVHYAADGTHFSPLNAGLERVAVWGLAVLSSTPNSVVLAGTSKGLYWRTLP